MNAYNQTIMTVDNVISHMLTGKSEAGCVIKNNEEFESYNAAYPGKIKIETQYDTLESAHNYFSSVWFMPLEYHNIDVLEYCLSKVHTEIESNRIKTEYQLFLERNLITLLRYFVYLVDTMQSNNILWGVGRGSSVASYILYIIGIHRIDSIKYNLDISEFLK